MGKLQEKNIVHILFLQKVVIFVEIAKADMPECNDNLTGVPIWGAGHNCASYQSPGKEYCVHSEIAENCSFCGQCAMADICGTCDDSNYCHAVEGCISYRQEGES